LAVLGSFSFKKIGNYCAGRQARIYSAKRKIFCSAFCAVNPGLSSVRGDTSRYRYPAVGGPPDAPLPVTLFLAAPSCQPGWRRNVQEISAGERRVASWRVGVLAMLPPNTTSCFSWPRPAWLAAERPGGWISPLRSRSACIRTLPGDRRVICPATRTPGL
jgi:hypothetical protein